jgi:peptidoglycan-associated lipoprotein
MRTIHFAAIAAAFALASGCTMYEPDSPVAGLTRPVDPPMPPDLGHGPARVSVDYYAMFMTNGVRSLCAGPDPYFKFNSATTGARDQPTMQVLANCLETGPLRGRTIRLVGRADPRGSDAYNERLGLQRAERVKRYLVDAGVAPERVVTASAGKDDASPFPKDWPTDRRVDIELVP